jgi:hypothetical protein
MKKLLILSALICSAAQAQQSSVLFSGQELYTRLTSMPVWAYGYISGVADSQSGVTICIPPNTVTVGQMGDMVKQMLERVPSERHLPADAFIQAALSSRWPCAKKGGGI